MTDQPENLVLVQIRGVRRELAAVLENQARDRQLITRIWGELGELRQEVGQLRSHTDQSFLTLNQTIQALRLDMISLENGLLNRHNEILAVMRRLDENGEAPDQPGGGPAHG